MQQGEIEFPFSIKGFTKQVEKMSDSVGKVEKKMDSFGKTMTKSVAKGVTSVVAKIGLLIKGFQSVMKNMPEIGQAFKIASSIMTKEFFFQIRQFIMPYLQKMHDWTHMNSDIPHAVDVEYDTISPMSIPYLFAKWEYSQYWKSVQSVTDKDKIIDKQISVLTQMMMIVAPFVKNRVYSYEKESRIIQVHKTLEDIKFKKNSRDGVTPYIETEIPTSCLKEVIVGPCCDFDLMKKCIEIRLWQKGIEEVEINRSAVPYRG